MNISFITVRHDDPQRKRNVKHTIAPSIEELLNCVATNYGGSTNLVSRYSSSCAT